LKSAVWEGDWPITQPWGPTTQTAEPWYRSGTTITHWHCGVDIGMPTGTKLYAARGGIISRNGWGLLGMRVGNNLTDYYIHIDRSLVVLGEVVKQGQLIAYSGNKAPSGGSTTGAHLHFEANAAGLNVPPGANPIPVLTAVFSSGGGTVTADLTPEEHDWLKAVASALRQSTGPNVDALAAAVPVDLIARLDALQASVAALKLPVGSGDSPAMSAAVAAIQSDLDELKVDLLAVKKVTDGIAGI
jgi:murein DD-endopeptidase MepM/ murein hydrolase activator NlpD